MNFVIAYGYDRDTQEYTGPVNAWEDQLTPGEFLIPAHATFTEPPAPIEGKRIVWNGTAWTQVNIPTPPAPPVPTTEQLAATARGERDSKLYQSDWTQLPDVPLTSGVKAQWATYRQALRDVPQQPGFPATITWPTAPGA